MCAVVNKLIRDLVRTATVVSDGAQDDDVLDAWLDEDEIDASGL